VWTGLAAAAVMPATLSIISDVFVPRERGRAIGVWSGAVGIAVAVGPVTGGFLLEHFWWGSVFLINVPIVLVGMGLAAWLVPESRDPDPRRRDLRGMVLSLLGLVLPGYGSLQGGQNGFHRPRVLVLVVGYLPLLADFLASHRRDRDPLL